MGTLILMLTVAAAAPVNSGATAEARKAQAVVWQKKADQLFSQGKYKRALAAAQRSYQLFPTARTAYNVALIQVQLGQREPAFDQCVAALNLGPTAADQTQIESTLAELGPLLTPPRGWLHVVTEPAPAEIVIAPATDRPRPSPFYAALPVGGYTVQAQLPGYRTAERTVEVAPGLRAEVLIALSVAPVPADAPIVLVESAVARTQPAPPSPPGDEQVAAPSLAPGQTAPVAGAAGPAEHGRPLLWTGVGLVGGGTVATLVSGFGWLVADTALGAQATPWSERQWLGWGAVALCGTAALASCVTTSGLAVTALALLTGE